MEGIKMRSVVVKEPGQLNIESRPVPVPGAHEVRVKIAFAGICGSDVHIYHG
ncbi:alcohol dehydrogenase catalytic domain-containing protein, partial [Pseudomonas aeruginosa]|nr:alcohol dehydrogenase catalytic domain-containing protein [Pseudomonas aeruginosa]